MNMIQKLRQLAGEISAARNGLAVVDAWALAERLLTRVPVDQAEAARAVREKDHAALVALLDRLERPAPAPTAPTAGGFTEDDLAAALRAFKKRLRVMRLSDESRLGGRYTSGGRRSGIDAIEPPTEFPPAVWRALVAQGHLRDTGGGFYALPE